MDYLSMAQSESAFLSQTYRLFHRIPEPSHFEVKTNAKIREILTQMGIAYEAPTENITIAVLENGEGKTVALRADTDALQQTEQTGLPFASETPGVMHACGHDAHITCALTLAKLMNERKSEWKGRVKIIFQPAEEGELGAQEVLRTQLVNDVDAFFGLHVWSPYQAGEMHVSVGGVAPSCDMFSIKIHGRACHGAMPHEGIDTVVCASALVQNLQPIASRFTSPFEPVVVTIGSLHAGTRCNIIADEAVLEGTIRTFSPETYAHVHAHFDQIVKSTCENFGCTYEVDMRPACGVTWNDDRLVRLAQNAALKIDAQKGALPDEPTMLSDDMADYRSIAPICYVKVGVRNEEIGACHPHHSGLFRIDETALPTAVAWLATMMEDALNAQD